MTWLDILYGLIFHPVETLRVLSERKPLIPSVFVFAAVYMTDFLLQGAGTLQNTVAGQVVSGQQFWLLGLIGLVFAVMAWFLSAALFSLLAELLYGKSNGKGILASLGFAVFPGVLGPALYYAAGRLDIAWLGFILYVVSISWVLVLQIISVRESFSLGTGQAVLVYFLPVVLCIMAAIFVIGISITMLGSFSL